MYPNKTNNQLRTPEERTNVHARLLSEGADWVSGQPDYTTISKEKSLDKLESVYKAVDAETDSNKDDLHEAYERSIQYVHTAFDFYSGAKSLKQKIGRAFVVPMRSNRTDEEYASESTPFIPLLDPERFGVDSDIRMRAMYALPPHILDTYLKDNDPQFNGALVLAPVFEEMKTDYFSGSQDKVVVTAEVNRAAQDLEIIMGRTARFAHGYLGANVIGLGATLPGLTNFGRMLKDQPGITELTTTTGHGGTVYTIIETARKIIDRTSIDSNGEIGVIGGAGSIGWSSTIATLDMIDNHKVVTYDTRENSLRNLVSKKEYDEYKSRIDIAVSIRDVIERTNVIVTAVTSTIDLTDPAYDGLDLRGKVIIDDSQPGCFNKSQVEALGGKLVWVVGEDGSQSQFMTRDGYHTGEPYNYGASSGLYGPAAEFACGQEAAVIAAYGAHDRAITGRVEPRDVRRIGELFKRADFQVAQFQAFGEPVEIK